MPNYATKFDLKIAAGVHTSKFAKKNDLASLKSDIDKLVKVPVEAVWAGLSSLKSKLDNLDSDKLNISGVVILVDLLRNRLW